MIFSTVFNAQFLNPDIPFSPTCFAEQFHVLSLLECAVYIITIKLLRWSEKEHKKANAK